MFLGSRFVARVMSPRRHFWMWVPRQNIIPVTNDKGYLNDSASLTGDSQEFYDQVPGNSWTKFLGSTCIPKNLQRPPLCCHIDDSTRFACRKLFVREVIAAAYCELATETSTTTLPPTIMEADRRLCKIAFLSGKLPIHFHDCWKKG